MSGAVGDRNLARAAELALELLGDHPSLFFEGTWYSSGEQAERAARIGAGLVELGLQPGDRVIVMMENSPDVPVVYEAIWRAGAVVTPAIFLLTPDELRRIVSDSGASCRDRRAAVPLDARQGCGGGRLAPPGRSRRVTQTTESSRSRGSRSTAAARSSPARTRTWRR